MVPAQVRGGGPLDGDWAGGRPDCAQAGLNSRARAGESSEAERGNGVALGRRFSKDGEMASVHDAWMHAHRIDAAQVTGDEAAFLLPLNTLFRDCGTAIAVGQTRHSAAPPPSPLQQAFQQTRQGSASTMAVQ